MLNGGIPMGFLHIYARLGKKMFGTGTGCTWDIVAMFGLPMPITVHK